MSWVEFGAVGYIDNANDGSAPKSVKNLQQLGRLGTKCAYSLFVSEQGS